MRGSGGRRRGRGCSERGRDRGRSLLPSASFAMGPTLARTAAPPENVWLFENALFGCCCGVWARLWKLSGMVSGMNLWSVVGPLQDERGRLRFQMTGRTRTFPESLGTRNEGSPSLKRKGESWARAGNPRLEHLESPTAQPKPMAHSLCETVTPHSMPMPQMLTPMPVTTKESI